MNHAVPPAAVRSPEEAPGTLIGWYLGVGAIGAVLAIGLALWFIYHP